MQTESWGRTALLLLEGTLTSENWLECARLSSHAILGSVLMYGCQAMVAVLLINMLIAMMAKTFDHVWEAQELNYQFLLAQTVLTWRSQPTNPPPFNVLRIPYWAITTVLSIPAFLGYCRDSLSSEEFERRDGGDLQRLATTSRACFKRYASRHAAWSYRGAPAHGRVVRRAAPRLLVHVRLSRIVFLFSCRMGGDQPRAGALLDEVGLGSCVAPRTRKDLQQDTAQPEVATTPPATSPYDPI